MMQNRFRLEREHTHTARLLLSLREQVRHDLERLVQRLCSRHAVDREGTAGSLRKEIVEAAAFLRASWEHLCEALIRSRDIQDPVLTGLDELRRAVHEASQNATVAGA